MIINVGGGGGQQPTLQTKTESYTPTESVQTDAITADVGYDGLAEVDVTVGAIPSNYVGSAIDRRDSTDITVSGDTITAPSGYYASSASASVASGSATTPATTINPSIFIGVQTNGQIDVTVSKTQSVTPTVTPGYVTSGTAGNITVSGSGSTQLDTQGATTITPTESVQTAVASGKYTTGAVSVGAIPSNYVGSGVPRRDSTDLSVSGDTITAPSGYYANSASESVQGMTLPQSTSSSPTGTTISTLRTSTTTAYLNIPVGYNDTASNYEIEKVWLDAKTITQNGTYTASTDGLDGYSSVVVNVQSSQGMNKQFYIGTDEVVGTSYQATDLSLTVAVTGTYTVSWDACRNTTSGTSGTQLYINGSAYGTAITTWTRSYWQHNKLTGVALTQGQTIVVRARARGNSNYTSVGNLIIEQTA